MELIRSFVLGVFLLAVLVTVAPTQESAQRKVVRSKISILDIGTKQVKVVYAGDTLWEAPNWSSDGKYLLANSGGKLYRIALASEKPQPEPVNLDTKYQCNNDHGISADGKLIAFSAWTDGAKGSQVYIANADGSNPRLVTEKASSYYHGWSPDGKWLAFVAERGDGNFDIYRVPVKGGAEERLTWHKGYDDGPDYSPDGKWIYINTDRSGTWDVWRFPAEGAGENDEKAERVTSDEWEDWFPHPSPDGKWMVFLSFPKGTKGHDGRMNIQLRMMPMKDDKAGAIKTVVEIVGGQGTINVNSWSPDSKKFAFVSFELE